MKKIVILFIYTSSILLADDLIVDKNYLYEYQSDNFLRFDYFDFDNNYYGIKGMARDTISLGDGGPVFENFTVELWVRSEQKGINNQLLLGNSYVEGKDRSPTIFTTDKGHSIMYGFGNGSTYYYTKKDSVISTPGWHHIAYTYDGTNSQLYVDGVKVDSTDKYKDQTPQSTPIRSIGTNFFGDMDEIRMWKVARTEAEIFADMNKKLSGNEENLVAYYPMEVNNKYQLTDLTPKQNHGMIRDVDVVQKFSSNNCPTVDGSSSCPYPTINSAMNDAKPGDKILIKEGRYSESISRLDYNNVKIEAYPDHDVMLDGTVSINAKWEPYDHNGHQIYKAVLDLGSISKKYMMQVDSVYSVFVNNRYMIMSMPTNFKNPTDPTIGNPRDPEPGTLFELGLRSPVKYDLGYQPGELANLDTLEEWSYDPGSQTLYLYPSPGYIPDSTNVRIRTRKIMVMLRDSDNIEFRNLHFFSGSLRTVYCDYFVIEDSKFSFSSDMKANLPNQVRYGEYGILRNTIFENMNSSAPWQFSSNMYPLIENVMFNKTEWFRGSTSYPMVGTNYRGAVKDGSLYHGGDTWRYVTVKDVFGAGIFAGYRSLVEYGRFENLYEIIDGSGVQRNGASSEYSTTRYSWIINGPDMNGMRWNSACGGTYADAHHVVSVGNRRGFRLKGDYHDALHLLTYENSNQDISLPAGKYCGPDRQGAAEPGNVNSILMNTITENGIECANVPGCKDNNKPESLESTGNWFAYAFNYNKKTWGHVMHHLENPWSLNRAKSDEKLEELYGEVPWEKKIQNYDFRPKKGSILIDAGKVIEGINDGTDKTLNHKPSFPGQNRKYVGAAPDVGPYEYGDSVYWIPGYRYPHPSVPIPSNGTVNVPLEYGLAWNYPYKKDYTATHAIVAISGPGLVESKTFKYPNNVMFVKLRPGSTYHWSVYVDGVNGGKWSFTTADEIYPINDRSVDTTKHVIVPEKPRNDLTVSNGHPYPNHLSFLRFEIPPTIDQNATIKLNLTTQRVTKLTEGIVVFKFNYKGWNEKFDNKNNIGVIDRSLLTPIDTIFSLKVDSTISVDVSSAIDSIGEVSFALSTMDNTDNVSFYSKEKIRLDERGDAVNHKKVWPNLSFDQNKLAIHDELPKGVPTDFALHDNYPNPFNPTTTLRFDLPEISDVRLTIYNVLGKRVKSFKMQNTPAGYHSIRWDATNDFGSPVSAGVYLYQFQAKDFVKTRKMILLK